MRRRSAICLAIVFASACGRVQRDGVDSNTRLDAAVDGDITGAGGHDAGEADVITDADSAAASTPCWNLTAPLADPKTPEERVCSQAIQHSLDDLYSLIGQYEQGDVTVYSGNANAQTSVSSGTLSGPAVARLVPAQSWVGAGWTLEVRSRAANAWMSISQLDADPLSLLLGEVLDPLSYGGDMVHAPANGVLLASKPASIVIETQSFPNQSFAASASLSLERVLASSLSALDLLLFSPFPGGFAQSADELVRTVNDTALVSSVVPPELDAAYCNYEAQYQLEEWISSDGSSSGVRNVTLGTVQLCCTTSCWGDGCNWECKP